jgi:hypothetical protein
MKNATQKTPFIRTRNWPVLGLLVGTLTAMCLPTHAADVIAPAKKASAPASNKVAAGVKAAPHNTSNADKKGRGKVGPGPQPPVDGDKQAAKVKKNSRTSKTVKKTATPAVVAPAEAPVKK